jgi:hypothetical protein
MAEHVTSTLDLELVVRVDRGDGTIEEKRSRSAVPMSTAEGAIVHALVGPIELFLDDLIPADEQRVPREFVRSAAEMMDVVVPAFAELEARYRDAMRALGQAPNLTMQLDAASVAALAAALSPTINVEAPAVTIENQIVSPERVVTVKRSPQTGLIESAVVQDV